MPKIILSRYWTVKVIITVNPHARIHERLSRVTYLRCSLQKIASSQRTSIMWLSNDDGLHIESSSPFSIIHTKCTTRSGGTTMRPVTPSSFSLFLNPRSWWWWWWCHSHRVPSKMSSSLLQPGLPIQPLLRLFTHPCHRPCLESSTLSSLVMPCHLYHVPSAYLNESGRLINSSL